MSLPAAAARRPVAVLTATLAVAVFGALALERLPVELLPDLRYPTLTVQTTFPDAAPLSVEQLVTRPIEEAVAVVPGVREVRSVSRAGLSEVTVELAWGRDPELLSLDVREKLGLVRLPDEVEPPRVLRFDPSLEPVARLALVGDRPLAALRDLAERWLEPRLEAVDGVAAATVRGGRAPELLVLADRDALAARGLALEDLAQALRAAHVDLPAGSLRERDAVYLVRTVHELDAPEKLAATVVRDGPGGPVRVGDVARVERGAREQEEVARLDGRESIELAIHREGSANVLVVAAALRRELEALARELPPDVRLVPLADASRYVGLAVRAVWADALAGALLAALVIWFFLRDPASTAIVVLSIPVSVVAAFLPMQAAGVSLNVMSLGGLALGVGMLVDNSIVVLEAISRRREAALAAGAPTAGLRARAAAEGAGEVAGAVTASTLTTLSVFVPIVFVEGVAGQLFRDLAVTVCASLLASLAVSLTLIPALAALGDGGDRPAGPSLFAWDQAVPAADGAARPWTLRLPGVVLAPVGDGRHLVSRALTLALAPPRVALALALGLALALLGALAAAFHAATWPAARALDRLGAAYPPALGRALRRPLVVAAAGAAAFLAAVAWLPRLGLDLVPDLRQGELSLRLRLPEGTALPATADVAARVERALREDPRVARAFSIAGSLPSSASGRRTAGEALAQVDLVLAPGADEDAVVARARRALEAFPRVSVELARPTALQSRPQVEVLVHGEDLAALDAAAEAVAAALREVPGVDDVASTVEPGSPELEVVPDRERAAALGVSAEALAQALRRQVRGEVVARVRERERRVDVRVRLDEPFRARAAQVALLPVRLPSGRTVPVSALAEVRPVRGPAAVHRAGGGRVARVTARAGVRDLAQVLADVRAATAGLALPAGVTAELAGQDEELARAVASLRLALALAVFLVFVVMAVQFESVVHPFVVLLSVPLGLAGVVGALALSGTAVSVLVLIGAVMLAGIVVNNAIVLVDAVNRLRGEGLAVAAALTTAGRERLRPILMTTATTVLALLPMALGLGEGAELRRPLAVTVTGGLLLGSLLTLVVVPCLYALLSPADAPAGGPTPAGGAP